MTFGCIDIGSNTTRLLVAEVEGDNMREIVNRRVFTRLGASALKSGEIPPEKIDETARLTAELAGQADALGAGGLAVVATAAVRDAPNRRELEHAVKAGAGVSLRVLSGSEEATLTFAGACHALSQDEGRLAVVDVGGGSSEIAIGPVHGRPEWFRSLPIGSSRLCERHLRSDPPAPDELQAAQAEVDATMEELDPPAVDAAVAVGGTATSLHQLVGPRLTREALEAGLARLCSQPAAAAARELGLAPERARLLPAGITVLCGVATRLGCALRIVPGGVREGAILELAATGGAA